jgi:Protein of unknown function (DUF3558)
VNHSGGKLLAGPLACVLAVGLAAGCSSSKGGESFPTTPAVTSVTTPVTRLLGKPLNVQPCTLATAEQVKYLLGVTATGVEVPGQKPNYKACTWTGAKDQSLSISVIRLGKGQVGFTYTKVQGLTSTVVSGLGSRAIYLSGAVGGTNSAVLAADGGSVSVSIALSWKGTLPKSESLKENLTTLMQSIFAPASA